MGRTFQLTRIFARITVLENMLVATQRDEGWLRGLTRSKSSKSELDAAMEWLDFVGIARLATLPAGSLSYGQRKLLELAYVLVADPDVILLDEPAGGVNLTLINEIAEKIRALNTERQDVPDRGAQHGVRHEPLRLGDRDAPGHRTW